MLLLEVSSRQITTIFYFLYPQPALAKNPTHRRRLIPIGLFCHALIPRRQQTYPGSHVCATAWFHNTSHVRHRCSRFCLSLLPCRLLFPAILNLCSSQKKALPHCSLFPVLY